MLSAASASSEPPDLMSFVAIMIAGGYGRPSFLNELSVARVIATPTNMMFFRRLKQIPIMVAIGESRVYATQAFSAYR
jgi:hypothetical protein